MNVWCDGVWFRKWIQWDCWCGYSAQVKPHPIELRERVVAFVEAGCDTHRATGARLGVSVKFVNDMVKLKRETGSLAPKPQGNRDQQSKLNRLADWTRARLKAQPDLTLDALVLEIAETHDEHVHRSSVGRFLHRLGISYKKTLRASEQKRPDVAKARQVWITCRQPFMCNHLERLIFSDETSLKTNMIKTTGWAPHG